MSKTTVSLGVAQARKLIEKVLPTDADFDAFCLDYFPSVKRRFASGMERLAKENLLLEVIEPQGVLEKLQTYRPDEFKVQIMKLIDAGEIKLKKASPWPEMSPEAEEYMNQLKDLYIQSGFPFCESWALTPNDDQEDERFNELTAHEILEPFMMNSWKLTYHGMGLILDAIPLTENADKFLVELSVEYKKQKFPNYHAWHFEMNDDLEVIANELRARGLIEPLTFSSWVLTSYGKDLAMKIIANGDKKAVSKADRPLDTNEAE